MSLRLETAELWLWVQTKTEDVIGGEGLDGYQSTVDQRPAVTK
jgi:hypothetical protein